MSFRKFKFKNPRPLLETQHGKLIGRFNERTMRVSVLNVFDRNAHSSKQIV